MIKTLINRLRTLALGKMRPRRQDAINPGAFQVSHPRPRVLLFRASAPQPQLTQMAMNLVRRMPSPMGLVLVEYRPAPREWTSAYLGRRRTLSALVKIRDLLGRSGLDVAVVSPPLGVEVIVDHLGALEIRTGEWNEALVRTAFQETGFVEDRGSAWEDPEVPAVWEPDPERRQRVDALVEELKLKPADHAGARHA